MAILRTPAPLHLRLLARRLLFSLPPPRRPPSFSSLAAPRRPPSFSSLAAPRRFGFAASFTGMRIGQNAVGFRAFMSSSTTTIPSESTTEKPADPAVDGSQQIQVLEGLEAVRTRSAIYIGSTGSRGLHHLVYEILDNAIDEAQAGYASQIDVVFHEDNSVSIMDNGQGIPTDLHPSTRKSYMETVLTVLHAGGKFGGSGRGYSVSGGLHGVGLSVVNAVSEALEVTVWRGGKEYRQSYSRGKAVTSQSYHLLSEELSHRQGTCIRFWPDGEIFTTGIEFDVNTIAGRIRELAFLNPEIKITLKEEGDSKSQYNEYCYSGGLVEYVKWLNLDKKPLHDPLAFRKAADGITVDVALQWCSDTYSDTMLGYANSIRTIDGGTHIDGLKASLTRTINNLRKKSKHFKDKDTALSGEHVREGLTCIISVKVPNPEFEGQTKTRLGNPEVRRVVDHCVQEHISEYLELHPATLDLILLKALSAQKAAMAAKNARGLERKKTVLKSSSLPGKLADCSSSNPEDSGVMMKAVVMLQPRASYSLTPSRHYSSSEALFKCLSWGCSKNTPLSEEVAQELLTALGKHNCMCLWDLENSQIPYYVRAERVADILKSRLFEFYGVKGPMTIRAYADFTGNLGKIPELLDISGVQLIHTPHGNMKEVADKQIIKDLGILCERLLPCTVYVITGDKGFASHLNALRLKGHRIIVSVPIIEAAKGLTLSDVVSHWPGILMYRSKGNFKSQQHVAEYNFLHSRNPQLLKDYAETITVRLMAVLINSPKCVNVGEQLVERMPAIYASYFGGEQLDLRLFRTESLSEFVRRYAHDVLEICVSEPKRATIKLREKTAS